MQFIKESFFRAPVEELFAFYEQPEAFATLHPPWEAIEVVEGPRSLAVGTRVVLRASLLGPIKVTLVAEHVVYRKNECFEDVLRRGPFAHWHHRHLFRAVPTGSVLRDEVDYELPFGPVGRLLAPIVEPRLQRMFDYRHTITRLAVERLG